MKKATRLQFDFAPAAMERLNAIKSRLDITTNAALIGYSLKLIEWFADQRFNGNQVLIRNANGEESILKFELKKDEP